MLSSVEFKQAYEDKKREFKEKEQEVVKDIHLTEQDRLKSILTMQLACVAKGDLATAARYDDMLNKNVGFYEADNDQQRKEKTFTKSEWEQQQAREKEIKLYKADLGDAIATG